MAMEKLVLRGIMYGADKVPDSWFDKVPFGYYKAKPPKQGLPQAKMSGRRSLSHGRSRRRYSDEYDSPPRQDFGRRTDPYAGEHKRADSHRSRSSHHDRYYRDQYADVDFDDRDPRHRHEYANDRAYQAAERQPRPDRQRMYEDVRQRFDGADDDRPVSPFTASATATAAAAAAAAGMAASQAATDNRSSKPADAYTGYVPYSNIYGPSDAKQGQQYPSQSRSSISSVQPTPLNQVTTSRQNPMSPDASMVDGAGDPHARAPPSAANHYPQDYDYRHSHDPYYDDRYPDHFYDEYDQYNARPSLRRRSYGDSFDSREQPWRSPSPPPRHRNKSDDRSSLTNRKERPRGKSLSRVKETFDKSQRGIGYGAVGAIAGGLVGSEVGKGAVPTAIGAVLGGLGANMFEARERSVGHDHRHAQTKQAPGHDKQRKKDWIRNHEYSRDDDLRQRRQHRERERRAREGHSPG